MRLDRVAAFASVVAAVVPIGTATTGAIRRGWHPIGDNAFFALRARDVLTEHHPLLGTWTSASRTIGIDVNNPGPLLFDVLALPAKVDPAAGLAIGVACINVAAVAGIGLLAHRRGGLPAVAAAMAACSALAWTMGSELLFDPWQPHVLLFPFLCFLFAVWSLVAGDVVALPWAVGLASFIVQTHLSYALLVPGLAAVGVAGLVVSWRRDRQPVGRAVAISGGVAFAAWIQPVVDQVWGQGNLATLLTHAASGGSAIGLRTATPLVAWVVALPPFWARPSFAEALDPTGPKAAPGLAAAALSLLLAVAALGVGGRWFASRRADDTTAAVVVAVAAVLGAVGTAGLLPVGSLGIAPHQLTWLWPIGIFATFALAMSVVGPRPLPFSAVAVVLGLLALPPWNARSGPSTDAEAIPTAVALVDRLDLGDTHAVLFDTTGLRFAEPYSTVVLLELQRRGIDFGVDDEGLARQVGTSRRHRRGDALPRLLEREGDAALLPPPGVTVASLVRGLPAKEEAELRALEPEIAGYIDTEGITLNRRGREAQRLHQLPVLARAVGPLHDPALLVGTAELIEIVERDLAPIEPAWRARFVRYADLRERWNTRTVALFLVPAP